MWHCSGLVSLTLGGGLGPQPGLPSHHHPRPSHSIQVPFVCPENSYSRSETQTKCPLCRGAVSVFSLAIRGSPAPPPYPILGFTLMPIKMISCKLASPPPQTTGSETPLLAPSAPPRHPGPCPECGRCSTERMVGLVPGEGWGEAAPGCQAPGGAPATRPSGPWGSLGAVIRDTAALQGS